MELMKIDSENFDHVKGLVHQFYKAVDRPAYAMSGVESLSGTLDKPGYFLYSMSDDGRPVGYIAAHLGYDEFGEYMYIRQVYSKAARVGNSLIGMVEELAIGLGVPRVKALCMDARVADASARRGYMRTAVMVEKYVDLPSSVQNLNERSGGNGRR